MGLVVDRSQVADCDRWPGKGDLGEAAGLARYKAEQADPLILADFLVTRCEGLSELVLDITDQLTAEVMGLRHAAPVQEAEGSVETGVVRTWTPDTAFVSAPAIRHCL
jgi:hypothetical protein